MKELPKEIQSGGKTLVFPENTTINLNKEGYFVLDFYRKFEDPDLNKIPAKPVEIKSNSHQYLIEKFNIILGKFKDYA